MITQNEIKQKSLFTDKTINSANNNTLVPYTITTTLLFKCLLLRLPVRQKSINANSAHSNC